MFFKGLGKKEEYAIKTTVCGSQSLQYSPAGPLQKTFANPFSNKGDIKIILKRNRKTLLTNTVRILVQN